MKNIKAYLKVILYARTDLKFVTCNIHKTDFIEIMFDLCCNFFICNWCCNTHKIIAGSSDDIDKEDAVHMLAATWANKRKKKYLLCFIFILLYYLQYMTNHGII